MRNVINFLRQKESGLKETELCSLSLSELHFMIRQASCSRVNTIFHFINNVSSIYKAKTFFSTLWSEMVIIILEGFLLALTSQTSGATGEHKTLSIC